LGCEHLAVSVLLIAPQEQHAWVVGPDHPAAPDGVPLCLTHADRISVPFGWALTDERPASRPARRAARPRKRPTSTPEPVAVESEPAAVEPEPEPTAVESEPVAVESEPAAVESESEPAAAAPPTVEAEEAGEAPPPPRRRDHPSSPAEMPINADEVAEAIGETSPRLSVVPGDDDFDKTFAVDPDGQTSLWVDPPPVEHEPDDSTPLLKRAFRVVRDD
jgi:hypothetical protein